ncbi:Radical SAM superfamily protein [Labrenzia sp. THAF82]|uniref:B12-binding domain-containing radical SAM protein n=1 Tax=Labrenzia sp. THAF82 TaxID=2587861 RepID=UPI0012690CE2|nr:radical SAM protein [Labrenzia sp. THAF82]QFT30961.1 Radical SAM superfamily protein [Labrenzia sp. THAF82]
MTKNCFHIILIRPTKYDDDGYPIHWHKTSIPANSLSCLHGIALDCKKRQVLGREVKITIRMIDEGNTRIRPDTLIEEIRADGGRALICFTGVQSNQFPRAVDLSRPFLKAGMPVAIGGFHITGSIAMLPDMPEDMRQASELGITFFLGEAEGGRFDQILKDAHQGTLKPVYDHLKDLPSLPGMPVPVVEREQIEKSTLGYGSFDLGRGCPFECSFCCIINVQGRGSRFRSTGDLETIIRDHARIGVTKFFVTDDNFARNRNWEAFLDTLIDLRERDGLKFTLIIQVDTLCHKIPNFIEKCVRAGVDQVFIGLENINPDNLAGSKKRQNKITDYRDMFLAWKQYPVVLTAGYIIGFPNDTRESVLNDIGVIKRELAVDILSLSILTPLPGSEDHRNAVAAGTWIDPDLNKYDLTHSVIRHPNFPDGELDRLYLDAWASFYEPEHCRTILRRAAALGSNKKISTMNRLLIYGTGSRLHNVFSLDGGYLRLKYRKDRRPGLKLENPLVFYPKYYLSTVRNMSLLAARRWQYLRFIRKLWSDPKRFDYTDQAIAPAGHGDFETLDLYTATRGGRQAVASHRKMEGIKRKARSKTVASA